jgi:hypothetical protein
LARKTILDQEIDTVVLVDEIDNPVWCTYGPAPNIAYLIGKDGKIVAKQGWFDGVRMEMSILAYFEER